MAKQLKDILQGVKKSTKKTNDLGGYSPKAGDEKKFAMKHEIEKHEDRVGNGDDVYNASNVKHSQVDDPHGYKKPKDAAVNEDSKRPFQHEPSALESVAEETKCNMSEAGTFCPIHEMAQCSKEEMIKEKPSQEVEEEWIVRKGDQIVHRTNQQKDALKVARSHGLTSTAVSATHGAGGKKASAVLEPHQKKAMGSFGPWGYRPPEKAAAAKGRKKLREMVDLEEGRGRPRKNAQPKTGEDEDKEHIVMQLRKSVSLRGQKHVKFDDGQTHQVSMDHAKKALAKHDSMHRAADKMKFAKQLSSSHSSLQKAIKESVDDESAEMAKAQLKALAAKATALADQLSDDLVVEPWVQSKIAIAKDYVTSVHDYMTYGDHEKNNEQTGPDSPMTFPNMNVDVAGQSI